VQKRRGKENLKHAKESLTEKNKKISKILKKWKKKRGKIRLGLVRNMVN